MLHLRSVIYYGSKKEYKGQNFIPVCSSGCSYPSKDITDLRDKFIEQYGDDWQLPYEIHMREERIKCGEIYCKGENVGNPLTCRLVDPIIKEVVYDPDNN